MDVSRVHSASEEFLYEAAQCAPQCVSWYTFLRGPFGSKHRLSV